MKISAAAKEYLIEIEVRKYTPKTIRSYRNNLNLFLRFCEEEVLWNNSYKHFGSIRTSDRAVQQLFHAVWLPRR